MDSDFPMIHMQLTASRTILLGVGIFLGAATSIHAEKLTVSCPHKEVLFHIEVPKSSAELAQGLMYRTELAEDAGMLFMFPDAPRVKVRMWMKNTILPLDMIFADTNGRILGIFENTVPYSEESIGPIEGTTQVLEIKAGLSKKHGLTTACYLRNHL
jgi:uncharacterized membrane protein (UPF0127 family)